MLYLFIFLLSCVFLTPAAAQTTADMQVQVSFTSPTEDETDAPLPAGHITDMRIKIGRSIADLDANTDLLVNSTVPAGWGGASYPLYGLPVDTNFHGYIIAIAVDGTESDPTSFTFYAAEEAEPTPPDPGPGPTPPDPDPGPTPPAGAMQCTFTAPVVATCVPATQ